MNETNDKTKHHFIRGTIIKDGLVYAPLIQVVQFCRRFPNLNSKKIGEMIEHAIKNLQDNEEAVSKIPKVVDADGGINDDSTKEA